MILFALVCACFVLEFQTINANIKNLDGLFILTVVNCDITGHVDSAGFQYQYLKIEKKIRIEITLISVQDHKQVVYRIYLNNVWGH